MSRKRILLAGFVAVIALTCLVLLRRPQARSTGESFLRGATVDGRVRAILERSCADCHSDATQYPWYRYVPVVSGIIENDVARGREQLNLSRWSEYSRVRRLRALTGIANQVRDRVMPLRGYLLLHPSAKLSDGDIETVFQWAQEERLRQVLRRETDQTAAF